MRGIWTLLVAILLTAIGACGRSDRGEEPTRKATQEELAAVFQEVQPIIDKELAKVDARNAIRFPCTVFTKEAAGAILKSDVEAPGYAYENRTLNDDAWISEACLWRRSADGPNLDIWVSKPEHFADGSVSCYGIGDADKPEALLGGQAIWTFRKRYGWAELLVCRDDALFHVEINDGPTAESEAREIAIAVASEIAKAL
jgi:hypothetical protein